MNKPAAFPSVGDDDEAPGAEPRQVFTRVIATRPGPPWDQSRQAALEARMGAPARLEDIVYRVRRLDPWRPGATARFAALYVRAEEARGGLTVSSDVDGRLVTVKFTSPTEQVHRLRGLLIGGAAAAAVVAILMTLAGTVTARRERTTQALETVERATTVRQQEAGALRRVKREARALDAEGLRNRRIEDVLTDLAWASRSKSATAHIQALHWDHGFMAVEAEGAQPPFEAADRPLERAKAPVRPGVWLWGVGSLDPWQNAPPRRRP